MMIKTEPQSWSLEALKGPNPPEPTGKDPQTGGQIWNVWRMSRTPEIDILYGMLHPGTRTGAHLHPDTSHFTTILEGSALVWIEDEIHELDAGDTLHIPKNSLHNFASSKRGELWFVDVTSPAWDPEKLQLQPEREQAIVDALN